MRIIDVYINKWHTLEIDINWVFMCCIIVLVIVLFCIACKKTFFNRMIIKHDCEIRFGFKNSCMNIKLNNKEQEIAYKIWIELITRKIGLEYEPENDVIEEVYNSWYAFFGIARELLKEIPPTNNESDLVVLTEKILNEGLRPHLTMWQARFRKWYGENLENNKGKSPQEIQKEFPSYKELEQGIIRTNNQLIEYKFLMEKLAFDK